MQNRNLKNWQNIWQDLEFNIETGNKNIKMKRGQYGFQTCISVVK